MLRRQFLSSALTLALGAGFGLPAPAALAAGIDARRLLVLVELKGGNDGVNTIIPYADAHYAALRPTLRVAREQVIALDERRGLHPALAGLLPLWQNKELAIVDSVGYPDPNLSHFRSIEIWDTASSARETLADGWLARTFAQTPLPRTYLADAVLIGSPDFGPLTGARAIALNDPEQFRRQARMAENRTEEGKSALRHLLKVESDISGAAERLVGTHAFTSQFPKGGFGEAVKNGCKAIAAGQFAVLRLTLGGFDTHQNQAGTHANLLQQLADGLLALKSALQEINRWQDTLIMTYAEFGRRPRENQSGGTDHGTAAPHFVIGPGLAGGFHGAPAALDRLDGNGNLPFAVDFRSLYASILRNWWGFDQASTAQILRGRFAPLPLWARG